MVQGLYQGSLIFPTSCTLNSNFLLDSLGLPALLFSQDIVTISIDLLGVFQAKYPWIMCSLRVFLANQV